VTHRQKNKSEMAVGYCTMYAGHGGRFRGHKESLKTLVYEAARYRNTLSAGVFLSGFLASAQRLTEPTRPTRIRNTVER